ncbi:hypothetical protein DASC09_029240 [Saccharomycopsis crataegensis]|uniref:AMP-dependent synthetase/ligase domain-containing protein n=1 Tax=Saccharomycopsis crataegensis TaxID=43959 RepID=A0AAV5QLU3_9ASCO|nr:hypothetical protein DASC09_029240 [Saccharomycopsis crataegensis]
MPPAIIDPPYYNQGDSVEDVLQRLPLPTKEIGATFELSDSRKPGYSPIIRNVGAKTHLITHIHPELTTLHQYFQHFSLQYASKNYLGYRPFNKLTNEYEDYKYFTYAETTHLKNQLGSAIIKLLENTDQKSPIITIYLPNCYQFVVIDLACISYSLVSTCLYDSLGHTSGAYIINLTESPIIFTTKLQASKIFSMKLDATIDHKLKYVVVIEEIDMAQDYQLITAAANANLILFDFQTLLNIGKKHPSPNIPPSPHNLFTICFTSGTTGMPKGAEITHEHVVAQSCTSLLLHDMSHPEAASFEFLPMAHCYERAVLFSELCYGFTLHFPHDPRNIASYFEDIKLVKPTFFATVPRVINKIEAQLRAKIAKSRYLSSVIDWKVQKLTNGDPNNHHFLYDKLIAPRIRAALGFQRTKSILLGSAPVTKETIIYLQCVLGINICQGYGSTETFCAGAISSDTTNFGLGTNGSICCNLETRLRDVPELEYSWDNNRSGELLLRGPALTKTYYRHEKAFEESLDSEGWFKTGDVAQFDEFGNMVVVDRVKNFFKLAQGKYIAAEKIEQIYLRQCPMVEQVYVTGDSLQHFLVGVVGVNIEVVKSIVVDLGIPCDFTKVEQTMKQFENSPELLGEQQPIKYFTAILNSVAVKKRLLEILNFKVEKLLSYERIKNAFFTITPFAVEKDTLTPTFKIKRVQVRKEFQSVIKDLYKEGEVYKNQAKL